MLQKDSVELNRSAYTHNDPVNGEDPTGMDCGSNIQGNSSNQCASSSTGNFQNAGNGTGSGNNQVGQQSTFSRIAGVVANAIPGVALFNCTSATCTDGKGNLNGQGWLATAGLFGFIPGIGPEIEGTEVAARGGTYVLEDIEGGVVRSGRTNDLARRELEHARDADLRDFGFRAVHRTDVRSEQRGLEQMLHDQHQPPLNKIRPISPTNPRLQEYMDAARRFLGFH